MARSKDDRHTKAITLLLLGAAPFAFLILLIVKMFDHRMERSQASVSTTEVVAESDGNMSDIDGRLFPAGSFLGLYNGEVYVCPESAPEPGWGEEADAVGADWTWLEATEARPAACRRSAPIGVSVIAAPALLTASGPAGSAARRGAAASDDSMSFDRDTAEVVVIGGSVGIYEGRTVTCVADSHAMRTLTVDEWDFAYAADAGSPGACYRWHGGGVLPSDWMKPPDKQDCLDTAKAIGVDAHIVERLKKVNPSELDDSERLDWRALLLAGGGSEPFAACSMYWSEPADANNGEKRNEQYQSCVSEWNDELGLFSLGQAFRNVRMESVVMMNYSELTRKQAKALREWLDEGHGGEPNDCHLYYPQLYTGRWIPLE